MQGIAVHWHDKPEIRKQRKMGHITIVGSSMGIVEEAQLKSMLKEEGSETQTAVSPCVGIIMGSDSDLPIMKDAAMILNMFGVPHEARIVSAHRTPEMMFSHALSSQDRDIQIIIAGAGGASHLPDAKGSPVATVAINNATNAGLLAVRMLGVGNADLLARMSQYQEDTRDDDLKKAEKLQNDGWESYLNL